MADQEAKSELEPRILKGPVSKSPKIMKTIGQVFFELCEKHPDKIFQIEADTGQTETYAQCKQRAVRLACAIRQKQLLQPGDTTMVCYQNTIHNIVPILATIFLGGSAASIDPMESLEEMSGAIKYTMPKIIFTEERSLELVKEAYTELKNSTDGMHEIAFYPIAKSNDVNGETGDNRETDGEVFDGLTPEENEFELYPQDPFDTAIYVFTSGTTSLPKPVALSHYGVLHGFKCLVDEIDNLKPEVMTHFASLYWISAILLTGVTLSHGGTKVIAPIIPASNLLEIIDKYKITFAFMSNTYTYDITNLSPETLAKYDTSSLYSIIIGGSTMHPDQLKRVREVLPHTKVTVGYGSSECAAVSAFDLRDVDAYEKKILSSGKLVSDVEVKIVDYEYGTLLPPNEPGEILVKSPYMMKGYHQSCTTFIKSPFDEEGFLKTGDLGYYDQDEYLYVTDRINDTFKYKTYQVSPLEIDRVLLTHPAVREAAAFNVYHEQDRNHAAALVALEKGYCDQVTPEDLKEYANKRLSEKNKIRAEVYIVDRIPHKTRTGKVQRAKIRSQFSLEKALLSALKETSV